ncbi:unnamed protein product [Linum trigynum]|uniref:Uncharacterized protein n=1 Tax=Linum trigynum TaxID=586398 RepID=A0AAV2E076_9ROSI
MKRFTPISRRGGAASIRGGRKAENTTSVIATGGGKVMERPRPYPPRRPGVSAVRSWPLNCGPRRDLEENGCGAPMVRVGEEENDEPIEEEPKEEKCTGLERENADVDATKDVSVKGVKALSRSF